ncbi:filamentous hemagglutinin N-terminal domain-containing protein, partial [Salmonella enterica]|nr:filamentous hemagglutinin N-terminal domain-containing protein [Salmonella enterica]
MNKIYKLKFDKRRNELVVVSEITAGMGKEKSTGHIADLSALSPFRKLLGTLTPLALLTGLIISLFPGMALANPDLPTGGQIVGGQGSISTSGNQMTIHQQTQNMATNWHSFDVGQNNTVQFVQPDSSSVALNRVTGASGSQIMGTLKANGQVFILNPNGVLFGKDARVNVAGLVASTKNINTADFMKGQYTLSGSGNPGAQVVNQGSLTTSKGGYIVLAGERVSNSGTVTTPGGKTVLAAGKTVTLQLDNGGLTSVSVNGSVVNALVENRGLISATDGRVYLTAKGQDMLLNTVVNNSGTIEAKGLASRGGEIVLNGGDSGVVSQSGQLLADSLTGQGGKITLEGQNIHLADSSLTSASGKTGGGEVYVGGGWQGKDSVIKNASKVVMDKTATVDVSARDAGNGGTAVLWSDDYTNFRGTVLAKGGAQSGNGGRVETSSHNNLQASGEVNTSARAGHGGEWLLDPTDVTIVGAGTDTGIDSTTSAGIFTPTASGAQILNSSIVNQLNAGTNVTVKTSGTDTNGQLGNITVNANIIKTTGADATLTLLADNNIVTKGEVKKVDALQIGATGADTGKLNLNLLAGNTSGSSSITLGRWTDISLNGGDFLADAAGVGNSVSLEYSNNGQIHGGNVTLNVSGGLNGYAYCVLADNDLTINGPVSGRTGWGAPLSFTAGGMLTMTSPGTIDLQAADTSNGGGSVVISGAKGVSLTASGGVILAGKNADGLANKVNVSSQDGGVQIHSDKGILTLNLNEGNISAKSDIILTADEGPVSVTGRDKVRRALVTSTDGSVRLSGISGRVDITGADVRNANLKALNGDVSIQGVNNYSGSFTGVYKHAYATVLRSVDISAVNVNVSGETSGTIALFPIGMFDAARGLVLSDFNITGKNLNMKGSSSGKYSNFNAAQPAGIYISSGGSISVEKGSITGTGDVNGIVFFGSGVLNLSGDVSVKGESTGSYGAYNAGILFGGEWAQATGFDLNIGAGSDISVVGSGVNKGIAVFGENSPKAKISLINNGAKLHVTGTATGKGGSGIVIANDVDSGNQEKSHIILSGSGGSTVLSGIADGDNGTGIGKAIINTEQVTDGDVVISGRGGKGGLTINSGSNISNVQVSGTGNTGVGVQVAGNALLNNATINGMSASGTGANINAPLTLSGVTSVSGTSVSGVGLNIAKTVKVTEADRDNITFTGTSTEKEGVIIGSQIDGGTVTGTSVSGDGVVLTNNAGIKQTMLNGSSTEGGGVRVNGAVTLDEATAGV